jgi:cyclopropane fatty-acyl-phospholipid synthase-like methyltransferase
MDTKSSQEAVVKYYTRFGSRVGYNLVMGGSKHFGYYDKTHTTEKAAQARFLEKFADLLDLKPGMRLLDGGCGQGVVACYLASRFDVHVTGVTLVPFEVTTSQRRARKLHVIDKTDFMVGDYADPVKSSGKFDRIFTVETLSHAPVVNKVLKNFYSMLKPDGKIVCVEYEFDYDKLSPEEQEMIPFVIQYGGLHGAWQFGPGEFMKNMKSVGFTQIKENDWTAASLPSFRRIRKLAKPVRKVVNIFHLQKHFFNTSIAKYYADMAEQGKFWFKAYTATKPKAK